ncbi:sensor histidine kinase [Flexithrix dorotheae]|uniref:sensor histidine kinase n=1 Tax=Flexithrix dorotheae TaxID=70993 RepID=UPI00036E9495|nr:ATP-binding protein [Flexithrix dorotheae]
MNQQPLLKIGLILMVIFLLPVISFSVYEISQLNQNEKDIKEIYDNQLDAILYSVNQYSNDVINSIASELNSALNDHYTNGEKAVQAIMEENESITHIFLINNLSELKITFLGKDTLRNKEALSIAIKELVLFNNDVVKKLFTFQRGGYRKIEGLNKPELPNGKFPLIFLLDEDNQDYQIAGLIVDPELFIQEEMGPKIQSISLEKFIITAFHQNIENPVYSTEDFEGKTIQQSRPLWLFPGYELGIILKGETIDQLVRQRSQTDLIFILAVNVLLLIGVVMVFRNIRKEVRLAQVKSDFVSNVSHEIRTPLSLISMFAETLQMNRVKSEEKKKEYYSIISQEAHRLSGIVNKILNFSQMEADRKKYHFEKADLNEIIHEVLNNYDYHLRSKGFQYQFQAGEIPALNLDKGAITESVINLLDNAIKYSEEQKKITIETRLEKNQVELKIKDSGIGISELHQKEIFEKFFRVTTGSIHNTKGTGLGLTLVKHIMEAHKGAIKLNSKLGEGSTFTLLFPIA